MEWENRQQLQAAQLPVVGIALGCSGFSQNMSDALAAHIQRKAHQNLIRQHCQ